MTAYKAGNLSWAITGEGVLIVDDDNDNFPEIDIVPNEIEILENKYLTLELEKFVVNDIDLVRPPNRSIWFTDLIFGFVSIREHTQRMMSAYLAKVVRW